MNELFSQLAADNGYFTRGQACDLGLRDRDIRAAVAGGDIVRLRHGHYAPEKTYGPLEPMQKHRVLAHSVADRLGTGFALSHVSAAALWGLDAYGVDLSKVHVTRLDGGTGRREAGVVYHTGAHVAERDLRELDGRVVLEPVRSTVESCTILSVESGMVLASSLLRKRIADQRDLMESVVRLASWQGIRRARLSCTLSDGLCESVGEVRSLHMCWRWHVPRPEMQRDIRDETGALLGRVDFLWPYDRHVGEFDGLIKYGRLNPYTAQPGTQLVHEKRREDGVRAQSLGMSRWAWKDMSPGGVEATVVGLRRALEQSRRLYARGAVHIPLG